jgi:hypothetical protein
VFTFTVNAGVVELTGAGDLHDPAFNNYRRSADVSISLVSIGGGATYSYDIYPSSRYQNDFLSTRPRDSAIQVVIVIFVTSLIFLIYDYMVSSREALLTATALTAYSVVKGLYPSFVRSRLLNRYSQQQQQADSSAGSDSEVSDESRLSHSLSKCKYRSFIMLFF